MNNVNPRGYRARQDWLWWAHTHIMRNMNVAIDEVRRQEVTQLCRDGYEPALTKARWYLLKRPENLTDNQATRLAELLQYNLKSVRAHLLR
jgi:transposase